MNKENTVNLQLTNGAECICNPEILLGTNYGLWNYKKEIAPRGTLLDLNAAWELFLSRQRLNNLSFTEKYNPDTGDSTYTLVDDKGNPTEATFVVRGTKGAVEHIEWEKGNLILYYSKVRPITDEDIESGVPIHYVYDSEGKIVIDEETGKPLIYEYVKIPVMEIFDSDETHKLFPWYADDQHTVRTRQNLDEDTGEHLGDFAITNESEVFISKENNPENQNNILISIQSLWNQIKLILGIDVSYEDVPELIDKEGNSKHQRAVDNDFKDNYRGSNKDSIITALNEFVTRISQIYQYTYGEQVDINNPEKILSLFSELLDNPSNIIEALNYIQEEIGDFYEQVRIPGNNITEVINNINNILLQYRGKIGYSNNKWIDLTTDNQIISHAINELDLHENNLASIVGVTEVDNNYESNFNSLITKRISGDSKKITVTQAINEVQNEIGDISRLTTSNKSNLVKAIIELVTKIGNLHNLSTDFKADLVGAINELFNSLKQTNDTIGLLENLDTESKTNIVDAINEVKQVNPFEYTDVKGIVSKDKDNYAGQNSFTVGIDNTGNNEYGFTFGQGNINTGKYNITEGHNNNVSGDYNSTFGALNNNQGNYNTVFGEDTKVKGSNNTVQGAASEVVANDSKVLGNRNFVGDTISAVEQGITLGDDNILKGNNNTILGNHSHVNGQSSFVLGNYSKAAVGENNSILGNYNNIEGSSNSTVIGNSQNITQSYNTIVVGNRNEFTNINDAVIIHKFGKPVPEATNIGKDIYIENHNSTSKLQSLIFVDLNDWCIDNNPSVLNGVKFLHTSHVVEALKAYLNKNYTDNALLRFKMSDNENGLIIVQGNSKRIYLKGSWYYSNDISNGWSRHEGTYLKVVTKDNKYYLAFMDQLSTELTIDTVGAQRSDSEDFGSIDLTHAYGAVDIDEIDYALGLTGKINNKVDKYAKIKTIYYDENGNSYETAQDFRDTKDSSKSKNIVLDVKEQFGIDQTLLEYKTNRGVANGYVPLNNRGIIDSIYLPSYVDDIIDVYAEYQYNNGDIVDIHLFKWEHSTKGSEITVGESGKIYVDCNPEHTSSIQFRWTGSKFAPLTPSQLVLGEIEGTAYEGSKGKLIADTLDDHIKSGTTPIPVIDMNTGVQKIDENGNPVWDVYKPNPHNVKAEQLDIIINDPNNIDNTKLQEEYYKQFNVKTALQESFNRINTQEDKLYELTNTIGTPQDFRDLEALDPIEKSPTIIRTLLNVREVVVELSPIEVVDISTTVKNKLKFYGE